MIVDASSFFFWNWGDQVWFSMIWHWTSNWSPTLSFYQYAGFFLGLRLQKFSKLTPKAPSAKIV
jgi:hypothetical protein